MRIDELQENWTASELSLKRYLRELRGKDFIEIKHIYDTKKKRFAGSYYRLKELSENGDTDTTTKNIKTTPTISPEQTPTKSRGSAKAESLQNEGLINNNKVIYNNTDNKYIESNTKEGEEEFNDLEYSGEEIYKELSRNNSSKYWDANRAKLYDKSLSKRYG